MNLYKTKCAARLAIVAMAFGCFALPSPASDGPASVHVDAGSATITEPLSNRFADVSAMEEPSFQKHVVPLLGRLGCNGRACHGSFQGQGDFQLSLFGYDFQSDYAALTAKSTGRVDVDDADESLLLAKPSDADLHEGGKRFELGSWQHHVLKRWIQTGANYDPSAVLTLEKLEVIPSEIEFLDVEQSVQVKAIAHWSDDTVENVTELCRFSSNDDAVAKVDENGLVRSQDVGDTHVVVFYDNAVVPITVFRPVAKPRHAAAATSKPVDQLVAKQLDKLGIAASGLCTDAEFIRRVSLDVTGLLPSADQVREFLTDSSGDKRERLVETLLESPGYAAWWATRFSDWTGNSEQQLVNVLPVRNKASSLWHQWLRVRLAANTPYDEIVAGIVEATSREAGESYLEYCEQMTAACQQGNDDVFAQREGLPFYWARRNFQQPEERAIGFAYTFLAVRIECAQCHKHPFDQWSKDDFDQFATLFTPIRANANLVASDARKTRQELLANITNGKTLNGGDLRRAIYEAGREGKVVPFGELLVNTRAVSETDKRAREQAKMRGRKFPEANIPKGRILGQETMVKLDTDPRPELMQWLRSKQNPYFAKAIVNRIWSNYFGIGIVNPTDDMNRANPPSNAPLLDYLAAEFIAHDFDLKWLHREIVHSDAYQRSAETNETNVGDRKHFSHHIPRRLPAEVVYDSVVLATGSDAKATQLRSEVDAMAIANGVASNRNQPDFALQVFGQSIRESNCDCDRSESPSLLQSIYLRNDAEIYHRLSAGDSWVAQACEALGVARPDSQPSPKQADALQVAEGFRVQIVRRLTRMQQMPKAKQQSMLPVIEREYRRAAVKFNEHGLGIPPLKQLMANPKDWASIETSVDSTRKAKMTVDEIIEEAYLRTLSRYPAREEQEIALDFIETSDSITKGVESFMWALLNTKEFIMTH